MADTRQVSGVPVGRCVELEGALSGEKGLAQSAAPGARGSVSEVLGGAEIIRWGRGCVDALDRLRPEIDALNVFPVPDSDTGTNLLATMRAAVAQVAEVASRHSDAAGGAHGSAHRGAGGSAAGAPALRHTAEPVGGICAHRVAAALARGASVGARGNSGLIFSQVLRGIAEATAETGLTGASYRLALARAAALARGSLSEPVEGTVLTVLDRASAAAADCPGTALATVVRAAAGGAAWALDDTRDQLVVLRDAGVVDAGGRGLLVLLDEMVAVVTGQAPVRRVYRAVGGPFAGGTRLDEPRAPNPVRYEVMFRLTGVLGEGIAALRSRLGRLGDSVVVASDGADEWSIHLHCADAGAAVEAALDMGRVRGIRIEYLEGNAPGSCSGPSHEAATPVVGETSGAVDSRGVRAATAVAVGAAGTAAAAGATTTGEPVGAVVVGAAVAGASLPRTVVGTVVGEGVSGASVAARRGFAGPRPVPDESGSWSVADRSVLAVAAGAGAVALFETAGAVVLGAEPVLESAALLAAIRRLPHREVLVLPNGALPAHELVAVGAAARDAHRDVLLLPSASMVQGLAALAVHDRARIAVDDAFAMSEAAAGTRWGALRRAPGRALTMVGTCTAGDGLGQVGHDVVVIDRDVGTAGKTLLDRMLGLGGELVTLLVGAAAPDGLAAGLAAHIGAEFPGVEVTVYSGDQQGDLIQIGVE